MLGGAAAIMPSKALQPVSTASASQPVARRSSRNCSPQLIQQIPASSTKATSRMVSTRTKGARPKVSNWTQSQKKNTAHMLMAIVSARRRWLANRPAYSAIKACSRSSGESFRITSLDSVHMMPSPAAGNGCRGNARPCSGLLRPA